MRGNYIKIVDIRGGGHLTGHGAAFDTWEETQTGFEKARKVECPKDDACFLADLHNEAGDLMDTVFLNEDGFRALLGEEPPTIEQSEAYDRNYWETQLEAHRVSV